MKTIMLLKDIFDPGAQHLIDIIAIRWANKGYRVISHYGCENLPEADIVVLHVDQTFVPEKYPEALLKYPVVLNRHVLDISKNRISSNILHQADNYSGPVIIKTNANYGGIPELIYKRSTRKNPGNPAKAKKSWAEVEVLDPNNYPISRYKNQVPDDVWNNPNLIVEKFLPEMEDGMFFLRYYVFLGDKGWASRFGSRVPIAKFGTMATKDEAIPVPDELKELRQKAGFDYGRFDYVEHNGKPVLLDVNKTLGGAHHVDEYAAQLDLLASGISGYL
jgi:hypothetical protein